MREEPAERSAPASASANPEPDAAAHPGTNTNAALQGLAAAQQLEHEGFWELAVRERRIALASQAAANLHPDIVRDALLAQTRLLLRLDRPDDAASALAEIGREPAAGTPAALLHARILAAQGRNESARDAYAAYIDAGGAANHRARLELARLAHAISDYHRAIREYSAVRSDPDAPALDIESALLEGGLVLEDLAHYTEANEWYGQLAAISPWVSDDTFALHRSAAVRLQTGDREGAAQAWTALLRDFPWHPLAAQAHDGLLAAGLPVDSLSEGLYFYRQRRLDDARTVYTGFLAGDPRPVEAAEARYYLAAIDEDRDEDATAIDGYLAAANHDPTGPLADDALWWAARLLEEHGSYGRARLTYERLATDYPESSSFAADAAFRAGLVRYLDGDPAGAANAFAALTDDPDPVHAQRALLWLGKARAQRGDGGGAAEAFRAAAEQDPLTYYGLRAAAVLAQAPRSPSLAAQGEAVAPLDAVPSEAWLVELAGPEPEGDALATSSDWQAALHLWEAEFKGAAAARFRRALAGLDDPWTRYRAGQALGGLGLLHVRLEAATALLEAVPVTERLRAPAEVLHWAYPEGWPRLARAEAHAYGLDELLLYALIRQESRFNPDAGSIAGALGLTQVIPSTGAEIALALGDHAFEPPQLFRPERSIRYGAYYLSAQLDSFDGAAWVALAAYNGGPGSAARWSEGGYATDPDLFYERIDFPETRLYLQLVLENYAWYQYIYRGASEPTLVTVGASPATDTADGR